MIKWTCFPFSLSFRTLIYLLIDWFINISIHYILFLHCSFFIRIYQTYNFVWFFAAQIKQNQALHYQTVHNKCSSLYQKTDNILYKAKQLFEILWKEFWTLILSLYRLQEGLYINVSEKLELKIVIIIIFSKIDNNIWFEFNLLSE